LIPSRHTQNKLTMSYPFSAGSGVALTPPMPGACDCHIHVYNHKVPAVPGAALLPPDASIVDYQLVQARMGTSRAVLVTPSTYGTDNTLMLEGLLQLGMNARGVAVIEGTESDEHLHSLHAQGVRGARINLHLGVTHDVHAVSKMAQRIAPLGWHLQLNIPLDMVVALKAVLRDLPVNVVFDHLGRVSPAQCGVHPGHAVLLELLGTGRVWIKLSGGYLMSPTGSVEYQGLDRVARSFIDAAPERVVWGSDWPHATASAARQPMPDDARQIDRLAHWAEDATNLHQILVSNPECLYGFTH
jgi:D-galactarolactone isomerase